MTTHYFQDEPAVSVVMGTCNRLDELRRTIEAVRSSLHPYGYEIIAVDGGSTDGSLEWLRTQPDVLTVEQGRLLGATRAYDAGFRLARAPYVVEINDDDPPIDDCIRRSIGYMNDHPNVGQAAYAFDCWKEDRYQFDTVFGKVYVNKGITRRELGDRAGWWDTKFHTYGADAELSCRIREIGYRVVALRGCRVKDLKTRDALREANNPEGVPNPDSRLFYEQRDGIAPPLPTTRRVLHVALNVPGDHQPALTRALRSLGEYRQIDWRKSKSLAQEMGQACDEFDPNLIFMQIQTPGIIDPGALREIARGRTIVNWSGDVRDEIAPWYFEVGQVPGVITCVTNDKWVDVMRMEGLDARYLQIGFNQEIYHPWGPVEKAGDIVFLGNYYGKNHFPLSKMRLDMVKGLRERYGDRFQCYGAGWPFPTKRTNHETEAAIYRGCKIAVGISEFDLSRYTSDRLFRAMGSGAFYLARWYPGCERDYLPEYHLDYWEELDELYQKIDYWLERPVSREVIARRGCEHVHANHTWLDRAQQLEKMIGWDEWM